MIELVGQVRDYAWGSRSFLAELQGRQAPSPAPEAEYWLGAHPDAPARVGDTGLDEFLAAAPEARLGKPVLAQFGQRLPYLLKILAAEAPLSIQVHPDAEQAREGFERGSASYTDPYPKPEMLVALTPFEALCGFRDPDEAADGLANLNVPQLSPVISALRDGPVADRLQRALALLLAWPDEERATLVSAVTATGQPLAVRLATRYPGDIGVLVALLLNYVRLVPGEAIFMPAGNVHAYLGGAGLELMGASDNVVRAGLTTKALDPDELMRLVRYEVLADPVFPATPLAPGLAAWSPPVGEFRLVQARPEPDSATVTLPGDGPRIVACVRGTATVTTGGDSLTLTPGRAVFVAADEPPVAVAGDADVYQAAPNI